MRKKYRCPTNMPISSMTPLSVINKTEISNVSSISIGSTEWLSLDWIVSGMQGTDFSPKKITCSQVLAITEQFSNNDKLDMSSKNSHVAFS